MTELLPCPWCGKVPELRDAEEVASIECTNIDCPMEDIRVSEVDYDRIMPDGWCRDQVIQRWNTRLSPWMI